MAFISESQHRGFLEALDQSIKRFEELALDEVQSDEIVSALKKEKDLLQDLFIECDSRTQQLRRLIIQYQHVQRKTRVELRAYRHKYGHQ